MDEQDCEILRELNDTLPDEVSDALPTDLDENFGIPEDTVVMDQTENGLSECEDKSKGDGLTDSTGSLESSEELTRQAAETEESVKALLEQEQEKDDIEGTREEFSEPSADGHMQISQEVNAMSKQQECSGCKKNIIDRFLLKALDQYWHEDCLKCSCCDCRLGEVGSTLFAKANLLLCRRDYLRLFGTTGYCSACSKMIPAFEMVMRAKSNVYHLECFACQMCNHRFCVGDRFYLCDNKILCEYDYEERMVFANMTYNYNALSQIKRQANSLSDDLSSGYGSPSPGSL